MRSSRRWTTALAAAVLLGACLTASPATAERTLSLSTGTFKLSLRPGSEAEDGLKVANTGSEALRALIYTTDITTDKTGNPLYPRPEISQEASLKSPASWISLKVPEETKIVANQPYLEMKPGDEFPVKFNIRVPKNAAPGDYNAAVFFEMFEFAGSDKGAVSRISGRIGTRVTFRVVGKVKDSLVLRPYGIRTIVIGDTAPFSFTVRNEGNIDKRYTAKLVVIDSTEEEVLTSKVETSAVVYAQARRQYSGGLNLKGLGPGKYTVRSQVEYAKEAGSKTGQTEPASLRKERVVYLIPLWAAIGAVVLVGIPLLWLSWRVGSRPSRKRPRGRRRGRPSRRDSSGRGERSPREGGPYIPEDEITASQGRSATAPQGQTATPRTSGLPPTAEAARAMPEQQVVTLFDQAEEVPTAGAAGIEPAAGGEDWVPEELFDDLQGREHGEPDGV